MPTSMVTPMQIVKAPTDFVLVFVLPLVIPPDRTAVFRSTKAVRYRNEMKTSALLPYRTSSSA